MLTKTGLAGNQSGATTIRLRTFCELRYTRVQDRYTSNFCFSKSLFSSIPTSTYTMNLFINPTCIDTMIIQHNYIVSMHCGMTIQLVLSVKDAYFYQSHF